MNQEVTDFINALGPAWQQELVQRLRELVHATVPDAEERIQYKKPHFLKGGKYAAVISPAKNAVSFMIFNATEVDFPKGFEGPAERKWTKIKEGETPDYDQLSDLLGRAASGL